MKKLVSVILFIFLIFWVAGCGGSNEGSNEEAAQEQETAGQAEDILQKEWAEIEKLAQGTEVRMFMWGGDENINRYMDEWVAHQLKEKYGLTFTRVPMDAPEFMQKLLTEKKAGSQKGSMDILWINGENFKNAKTNDLLYQPFVEKLPNYQQYVNQQSKNITTDFGVPVEGLEAPWGKVQFVFLYDSAKIPDPPKNFAELAVWVKANPGKFTYPEPADFTGNAFLRHLLYDAVAVDKLLSTGFDESFLEESARPMWDYLNSIKADLWRGGETYPQSLTRLDQLYSQGEVYIAMGYNEGRAEPLIKQGVFPETTKSFVMEPGSIGNTHFLAIPYNTPNPAGAMVAINFLLSPEAQLEKLDPAVWGDNTVLDIQKLSEEQKNEFAKLDRGASVLPEEVLQKSLVPEVGPEYVDWIKEKWMHEVVGAK